MTCGECKHFSDGSCWSLESDTPLHDLVLRSDPACRAFERRSEPTKPEPPILLPPPETKVQIELVSARNPLDMLSPETRAKLARREPQQLATFLDRSAEADR